MFRKVTDTEDTINEFAPTLRTEVQARAFRVALQALGNLCGFGINYFDLENVGYVKTATEVSADNSALMRNIRRHEHALEGAIVGICRALLVAGAAVRVALCVQGGAAPSCARNGAEAGGLRTTLDEQRVVVGCGLINQHQESKAILVSTDIAPPLLEQLKERW